MNDPKLTEILNEPDPAKQSIALNHVTVELLKQSSKNQKIQWIFTSLLIGACIIWMIFTAYENNKMRQEVVEAVTSYQTQFLEFMKEFEFVVEDTVTTTTTYDQEVSGDEANIVNGNQYNDNATHTQGVDDKWHTQDNPEQQLEHPQE